MLFLGIEMARRMKNATLKFSRRSFLSYHIRKLGGRGPKAEDFFEKCAEP